MNVLKTAIELLDGVVHRIKLILSRLHLLKIRIRKIALRLIVLAYDPLTARIHNLAYLVIHKTKEVSSLYVVLIAAYSESKTYDRT